MQSLVCISNKVVALGDACGIESMYPKFANTLNCLDLNCSIKKLKKQVNSFFNIKIACPADCFVWQARK